ncbi:hypothetical protein SODALDRAFT_314645 [Sodiomyces alkalinus F11]|uniref:DNA polymerase lambda n=1 Tax=Sodiomyces alkalinus (strain CBS 110278 / VKM F-3762 / F11) TaxID=1314773 RepID=A0A3N2PR04_SODAK|nr:hypothetical protein SODALDRAFT_314645 [Sodiomyces alkalinus F11]ROT36943.1 hypothetical protein SODALDRAFT_314645 [Sodiomyces alkalinus F11]
MHFREPSLEDKKAFFRELDQLSKLSDSGGEDIDGVGVHDETEKDRQRWKQALRSRTKRAPKKALISSSSRENIRSSPSPAVAVDSSRPATTPILERTPLAKINRPASRCGDAVQDEDGRGPSTTGESRIPDSTRASSRRLRLSRTISAPAPTPTPNPNPLARQLFPPRLVGSATFPAAAAATSTNPKKRKRDAAIKLVPENQQIFKGFSFYFIPNDDIAPARRIRIRKAQEHGATWTRALKQASHIIVDKSLCWKNIEPILSSANGAPSAVLVNETYPLDCVEFRNLLNPNQNQYYVTGFPDLSSKKQPLVESAEPSPPADSSLPLKPAPNNPKRCDYVPPPGTPSRDEESMEKSDREEGREEDGSSSQLWPSTSTNGISGVERRGSRDQERGNRTSESGPIQRDDELSEYISQMQQLRGLPLEEDEEEAGPHDASEQAASSDDGSADDRSPKKQRPTRSSNRKDITWEDRFACHRAGTKVGHRENPNARTIEVLQHMCDYYSRTNDTWRPIAYRKVISLLKRQRTKITTAAQAIRLPGVGTRLADKIEEIVATDRLQRLENASKDPADEALQLFLKIYGVGTAQAARWVAQGYRTLDDLRAKARLSASQRVGIDHFDDLNTRIPRWEVEALASVVRAAAAQVDPNMGLIVGGSYRRGAESSGDIDFILTKPGTSSAGELFPLLRALTQALEAQGFLVATLAATRHRHAGDGGGGGGGKWHGCCVLPLSVASRYRKSTNVNANVTDGDNTTATTESRPPIWRRIDFLVVPETELGAALIYFTGNDIFNRSMRLLASRKGMRLNQRGLYRDVLRGPGRAKVTDGELVEGRDERRIFDILGVQWREPHERWC